MKKGSLNLSINAIVTLILAVTLLSLGLIFINNTFGGATEELEKSLAGISEDRISQLKSKCQDPACLEFTTMTIKRNNEEKNLLVINNRLDCNIGEEDPEEGVIIDIDYDHCQIMGEGEAECDDISITTFSPQPVEAKDKVVVPLKVKPGNNAETTTYRYKVSVEGGCGDSNLQKTLYLDIEVE